MADEEESKPAPDSSFPGKSSARSDAAFFQKLLAKFDSPEYAAKFDAVDQAVSQWSAGRNPERIREIQIGQAVRGLEQAAGKRYVDATLANFEAAVGSKQMAVVERLHGFCDDIARHTAAGHGLVLYGPEGTGKDHLMVACLKEALAAGLTVRLVFGIDLYSQWRDEISKQANEAASMAQWLQPDILAISDPLPPSGDLTEHQAARLMALIHGRYRQCKPVWCTLNVAGAQDAAQRMTAQITGRLRDGALSLACNWPSYRKALQ